MKTMSDTSHTDLHTNAAQDALVQDNEWFTTNTIVSVVAVFRRG